MHFIHSGEDDVVDGDEDELDEVADHAHDEEAHDAGLQDLHVLSPVGFLALLVENNRVLHEVLHLGGNAWLLLVLLAGHLYFGDTTIILYKKTATAILCTLKGFWGFGVLGFWGT